MGKKVLLADDSATIQKLVEMALGDTDFELLAVSDGKQAVDQLETFRPDIVLADAIMPQMDGYEVSEHVKNNAAFAHTPVILLTGRFQPFDSDRAAAAKIDERVVKPFSQDQLVTTISNLLANAPQPVAAEPEPEPEPEPAAEMEAVPDFAEIEELPEEDMLEPLPDEGPFGEDTVHIDEPVEAEDAIPTLTENDTVAYSPDMLAAMAKTPEDNVDNIMDSVPSMSDFDDGDDDDEDEPMVLDDAEEEAEPMELEDDALEEMEPMDLEEPMTLEEPESAVETPADLAGEVMDDDDDLDDDEVEDVTMELTTEDLADIEPLDDEEDISPLEDEEDISPLEEEDDAPSVEPEVGAETLPASLAEEAAEDSLEALPEETLEPMDALEALPEPMDALEDVDDDLEDTADLDDPEELIDTVNLDEQEDELSEDDFRMALDEDPVTSDVDTLQAPVEELGVEEIDQPLLGDQLESVAEVDDAVTLPAEDAMEPLVEDELEELPLEDDTDELSIEDDTEELSMEDDTEELPVEEEVDELPDEIELEDLPDEDEDEAGDQAVPLSEALTMDDTLDNEPVTLPSEMAAADEVELPDDEPLPFEEAPVPEISTEELDGPILEELEEDLAEEPLEVPDAATPPPGIPDYDPAVYEAEEPVAPEPEPVPEPAPVAAAPEPAPALEQAAPPASGGGEPVSMGSLSDDQLDQLADKVAERLVEKLGQTSIKEIVWDVVPELAEAMIKKRIYQLEQSVDDE